MLKTVYNTFTPNRAGKSQYFSGAMVFNDIIAVHRYTERHGPLKLATVIKA